MSRALALSILVGFLVFCIDYPVFAKSVIVEKNNIDSRKLKKTSRTILAGLGICPQNRNTRDAPEFYLNRANPFPKNFENLKAGETLYQEKAKPTACRLCHGYRGSGNGRLAMGLNPPPRNFSCAQIMESLPDGQLFWIIRNGSKGTAMPAHKNHLTDRQIWQLITYIRSFLSKSKQKPLGNVLNVFKK